MRIPTAPLALGLAWVMTACNATSTDTGEGALPYCESMDDADSYHVEEDGGSGSSGVVRGWLITDVSDGGLHDPNFVASIDYTLEPVPTGGVQTQDKTDQDGFFQKTLGEGDWLWKHSASKSGYTCANEFQFEVVAGDTTEVCIDARCL